MRMLVFPQLSAERISRNLASLTAFICRVQLVREEAVSTKNVGTTGRSGPFSKLFGEIANRTSKAAGHALTFVTPLASCLSGRSAVRCFNIPIRGNWSSTLEPPS
jgi:hypothetical protein